MFFWPKHIPKVSRSGSCISPPAKLWATRNISEILGNSAIFCKKWLIFRVAQGLAGGMIWDPDLETLWMCFGQKKIMHTHLQG